MMSKFSMFNVSFRNYWSEDWNGLDVGHRGLGNSYTQVIKSTHVVFLIFMKHFFLQGQHCSHIRENTLASMQYAIDHGADMVEFDVQVISNAWMRKFKVQILFQLSRDEQPCVYHEFHLCVLTKAKQGHDVMVDVPVKVLSKF